MKRRVIAQVDVVELRRQLVAAGIDADYWSHDDLSEMERRGYRLEQMVAAARVREGKEADL